MTRIPEQEIERLKQEVSLQRLAEGMGITLKRHGADLIGLCPFHDDHEPSLVISPEKNLWHCLGACQTGGSVIDWVMKAEGVSFRHAVELLLADYAPSLVADAAPIKSTRVRKLPTPLNSNAEDQTLLQQGNTGGKYGEEIRGGNTGRKYGEEIRGGNTGTLTLKPSSSFRHPPEWRVDGPFRCAFTTLFIDRFVDSSLVYLTIRPHLIVTQDLFMERVMSQQVHFLQADRTLQDEYKWHFNQLAKDMGRANSRDNRVDWVVVNEKMQQWWEERGYKFP